MNTSGSTASDARPVARLEALAAALAGHGWIARLREAPDRVPSLYVQNPAPGASALCENVYAQTMANGGEAYFYWWSWAEPIAADPGEAADMIIRVLRTADYDHSLREG